MLLAQANQIIFAYQWFAAGVDVHIDAQFLALPDDGVNFLKAQVQLVAIFSGPAAGTVQVAGTGGVQQDRPRNITVVLLTEFFLNGPADNIGIEEEIHKERFQYAVVHTLKSVHNQLVHIVVRVVDDSAEGISLLLKAVGAGSGQLIHPFHKFGEIALRVFFDVAVSGLDSKCAKHFRDHIDSPFLSFFLFSYVSKNPQDRNGWREITGTGWQCGTRCRFRTFL